MLITVDPGKNHCAFAVWKNAGRDLGELIYAGLARNPLAHKKPGSIPNPEIWSACASELVRRVNKLPESESDLSGSLSIVCEIPVIRQRGSSDADPNDLLDLAGVVGALVTGFKLSRGAVCVWAPKPEEWKGQLPKSVTKTRVDTWLSPVEKARMEKVPVGLQHNILDAIHLGLVYFKRSRSNSAIGPLEPKASLAPLLSDISPESYLRSPLTSVCAESPSTQAGSQIHGEPSERSYSALDSLEHLTPDTQRDPI